MSVSGLEPAIELSQNQMKNAKEGEKMDKAKARPKKERKNKVDKLLKDNNLNMGKILLFIHFSS